MEVDSCASLQCLVGACPHPSLGPGNGWDLGGAGEGKERQYTPMAEGQKQPPLSVPGLLSPDRMTL